MTLEKGNALMGGLCFNDRKICAFSAQYIYRTLYIPSGSCRAVGLYAGHESSGSVRDKRCAQYAGRRCVLQNKKNAL